YSQVARPRF
uniref:Neuropeptide F n=1 Tax=Schistocerca gregaria TaxID=7010 RepID=NPF_SCHGR|nr:RecName: Full=Neuropeptide F; Short=NPF; Short=Scg-NPF [Schistocerca gregaria]